MKIFSAAQLKEADKISIKKQGITSEELMERAAGLVFKVIHNHMQARDLEIKIFCGIGNNGGDGLVIARLLLENGYNVKVFVVNYSNKRSDDFLVNYNKLKNITNDWPVLIKSESDFPQVSAHDLVIDAIFGIGLNRPPEGWVAKLIEFLNDSGAFLLAVDMPSGLFSDRSPEKDSAVIHADFTLSFQAPKLVFFLPDTMDFVGQVQILDIGLDQEYLENTSTSSLLIGREEAKQLYKPREKNSHKGTFGHSLMIGGSYGKIGSILLAATANLRTGAGLCSIFLPKCGYTIAQTALPEAMVITDEDENKLTKIDVDITADAFCFGTGVGKDVATKLAFEELLYKTKQPMVIDADGLNLLSENKELLKIVPENSVFTPHPKELERLIGEWNDDFDKIEKVQAFVKQYQVVLVLKGAHTFVFSKELIYVNNSGNPGMATAGSGDVLSGVITALISQKYDPVEASVLGVYVHGKSGDISVDKKGLEGILAGDIAANMGLAFKDLMRAGKKQ